jgi:hypothetical protein
MDIDGLNLSQKIENKFKHLKQENNFVALAKLITYAFQVNSSKYNREIFGYIPSIFRTIEIFLDDDLIQTKDIFIGEPVIYKIYYAGGQQLYNLPYFYIFCYLKEKSDLLNVYFQSANPKYKTWSDKNYKLEEQKIGFEGCISSFANNDLSVISISDPGHFIANLSSSYYVGSAKLNFTKLIAEILERITNLSRINLNNTLLFGSSAGTFGALLSSTYLKEKTNVLAVNSQINIQYRHKIMQSCFGISNPRELIKQFGAQISCLYRFQQKLNSIPNIYILANINDNLYQRNFGFYQNYLIRFTHKGVNNQSVFDSYYGVEGHGRPEQSSLKAKIRIAREVLTMKSTVQ